MNISTIIFDLVFATIAAGIIGYERERKSRPAGVRTHILVCVGATLIAQIQQQIVLDTIEQAILHPELAGVLSVDPARLTAQIISGIGFLGAGTIIISKKSIKGLTTAASLWAVASLGIAIGMGFYFIAFVGFLLIFIILALLHKLIIVHPDTKIEISYIRRKETREFIVQYFKDNQVLIRDIDFSVTFEPDMRIYTNIYTVELPRALSYTTIIDDISAHENVTKIRLLTI